VFHTALHHMLSL